MESRFSKYKSEGSNVASHIANVNNFIKYLNNTGLDLIEKEIQSLQKKIDTGDFPPIFKQKVERLVNLGEAIEAVYNSYHFNKNDDEWS